MRVLDGGKDALARLQYATALQQAVAWITQGWVHRLRQMAPGLCE